VPNIKELPSDEVTAYFHRLNPRVREAEENFWRRKVKKDWVLISRLFADLFWSVLVFGFTAAQVFQHGRSGWWFVLAFFVVRKTKPLISPCF